MDSQATSPLSPKKQFLAIFRPTPSLSNSLMRPCDGGDGGDGGGGSEDEGEECEGDEDEYEDEDEEGGSSFRSSNSSSLGTKLSLLESIEEEDSSLAKGEIERVFPVIESSPEESRNEEYFGRAFSEKARSLLPFVPPSESGAGSAGAIDSDTDHFGRPRTASRPSTPDGSKKIEFTAPQPGCIDCIIGIAGHHHGSSTRTSPAPTPTLSRSSSLKLKEPPLTPVEEESPQGIIERRERAEIIEATTAKLTNLTTLTPDTTPLKSSSYFAQQHLANGLLTPEATPLKYTAPQRQPQVSNETNSTAINDPMSPTSKVCSPPERPKLVTNYPATPARRPGGAQVPPTPPTTPARRKSLLYSRENSRESISIAGASTSTSSKDVAPTGTITPPPSEAASAVEAEETKIEERKVEEEKPKVEASKTEEPNKTADSESGHGHGHDGHDCPYLRRSASPRPSSLHSHSYSYSVPSTPEPVRPHSYSSPEVPRFTTHFHSGPSTPAPPVSRLSYSRPGTPEVSSSLSHTNLPPKAPEVSRLISQEFVRPSTPEVVFSGSGTASPFMDVSEPASRAPSPPPPSLAGGSTITTPASSIFLPARGPLAPAINLKNDSGIKSVSRSVSTSDFFPEQTSTTTPPVPVANVPATRAARGPEKQPNLLPENITVEVIHRLPFLTLPNLSLARIARCVIGPVRFASNAVIITWFAMLPLTLLIWTINGIAQLFLKPEVGSPMAGFNPVWALVPYFVLFAVVAVYYHGEGLKGGKEGSEGSEGGAEEETSEDLLDYFLDRLHAVAAQLRGYFTPRRIRRFTISLLLAASLIASYFALQYLAPHVATLAKALSSRIFSSKTSSPPLAPTAPTSGPWEDMDFMYFVPSTSTSEQSTSSGMEDAYGEYHPGANVLEGEFEEGLGWKGVLRLAAVLVMGPAGAVAVRRRTL